MPSRYPFWPQVLHHKSYNCKAKGLKREVEARGGACARIWLTHARTHTRTHTKTHPIALESRLLYVQLALWLENWGAAREKQSASIALTVITSLLPLFSTFLSFPHHLSRSHIRISIECLHWNCRSILHWHVTHTNASNGQIKVRRMGQERGYSWICCQCIGSNWQMRKAEMKREWERDKLAVRLLISSHCLPCGNYLRIIE